MSGSANEKKTPLQLNESNLLKSIEHKNQNSQLDSIQDLLKTSKTEKMFNPHKHNELKDIIDPDEEIKDFCDSNINLLDENQTQQKHASAQ